jgi:glucuronate isomerase
MKEFMDKDFELENETAKRLFHTYAENLPLIDYHCHISPKEIYENRRFDNIAEVWLGGQNPDGSYFGDHYKWRLMRTNGVKESDVTGPSDNFTRFEQFAGTLDMAIGNPMYHWCNLELHKYFGIKGYLSKKNAKEIWDICNEKLRNDPKVTVRGLIEQSNVAYIGTTDDPTDTLEWHEKIAADKTVTYKVCPSFRPDKAINITKAGFREYIGKLAKSVGKNSLDSADEVCAALTERAEYFRKHDCRASDHGIDYVMFRPAPMAEVNAAYQKAMKGEALTVEEAEKYQTAILLSLGRTYHRLGIIMEIHYSCLRNVNERMFKKEGPDSGFDVISQNTCGGNLAAFLNELDKTDELPKTILFSLNPSDNEQIDTILGAFQSDELPGKVQHGPAWWFCDTKSGMEEQMESLANLSLLGNFIGMLTDSRSFLSYTRHDYFRRIFCNMVGKWVENGEFPNDEELLKTIVEGVCYKNAARYFGF